MTARISHTSFDSIDAYAMSVFWAEVLGFDRDPDDPDEPGDEECLVVSPDGSQRRLIGLGARTLDDRRRPDGSGWVVLADPEGTEFCILRNDAERTG